MDIPLLRLCLLACQCVQTDSYYLIRHLAVVTSFRLVYCINLVKSAHNWGKWQTTDCQIKGRSCIQPMEINVQPYHKLLHWRQRQLFLPKRRYPANDPFHCVQRHWSNRCVTVVTKYSCYTHYVGSTVLYLQQCCLYYGVWINCTHHWTT